MFSEKEYEMVKKGEIVSTKSALAFDEDMYCKKCKHIFTLIEGNWEDEHPTYKSVTLHGIQCPSCKHVNVTYAKTPRLVSLEKKINNAPNQILEDKYRAKYQKLFWRVQKQYEVAV